jgi:hypothetical protein
MKVAACHLTIPVLVTQAQVLHMSAAPGSTPQELDLLQSLADNSMCLVVHLPSGAQLLLGAEAAAGGEGGTGGSGGAAGAQVSVRAVLVKPGAQRQQQQQQQEAAVVKQEPPTSGA